MLYISSYNLLFYYCSFVGFLACSYKYLSIEPASLNNCDKKTSHHAKLDFLFLFLEPYVSYPGIFPGKEPMKMMEMREFPFAYMTYLKHYCSNQFTCYSEVGKHRAFMMTERARLKIFINILKRNEWQNLLKTNIESFLSPLFSRRGGKSLSSREEKETSIL